VYIDLEPSSPNPSWNGTFSSKNGGSMISSWTDTSKLKRKKREWVGMMIGHEGIAECDYKCMPQLLLSSLFPSRQTSLETRAPVPNDHGSKTCSTSSLSHTLSGHTSLFR
jgi:hypothetical protein